MRSGKSFGCLPLLLVAGIFACVAFVLVPRHGGETPPPESPPRAAATPERRAEIMKAMKAMERSGAVHSIDADANEVRVTPAAWVPMDADVKRDFVRQFSAWFNELGSTGRVKVLSSKDDTVFAEYSVWSGVTIHR